MLEAIRDEGWTCEYHEPDRHCETCKRLHAKTLDAVLDTLTENADQWEKLVREGDAWLARSEMLPKALAVLRGE